MKNRLLEKERGRERDTERKATSRLERDTRDDRVPAEIQVAAICQLAYLVLEIALDADTGGPASVSLRVVDADRIRLLLHHVVVVVVPWISSPQISP